MKAVDLFAGCGGMSLGFQNAGFNIVAAFEFWDIAAECYEKNFNHPVFRTDLSDVDLAIKQISAFSPDLIIGGPPCQDFSHAGKRIESSRASLTAVSYTHLDVYKRQGVKRIRIHDLRHSHISLLIDMGFSAVAIADRVGHELSLIHISYHAEA